MYEYLFAPMYAHEIASRSMVLLDAKIGDVTGDGVNDYVYLYGNKPGEGNFAVQITLIIQDGRTAQITQVPLASNAGYNARLFLGDFSGDRISDILVSIDSGGSGGYGFFYVFSFKNNALRMMFDYEAFNKAHPFQVHYQDYYKVGVSSPQMDVLFLIDISNKGSEYLAQYYNPDGKLKQPTKGEVLALGSLSPIVSHEKNTRYDLIATQRIIGPTNADTLGYVVNHLTWKGTYFDTARLTVTILGSTLISLY
ncbi:FG-GAP repeat domain-containing protein [Paenibacillus dokdonensis]|uniref:FG-GAP repeat domain-containing protein n=1 Tax=Paenibacillus dokdonensis TaxID=2567944 RepID=UPI001FE9F30B|nr:VCBS repeat-containing protein [Paenibacillus dokdonensis]